MRKITYLFIICINVALLSSCHIYRNYQRPENLPTDSLFRDMDNPSVSDSLSLGDLPWQEVFQDTLLQHYIRYGLEHNTDMQTALLRVDQAHCCQTGLLTVIDTLATRYLDQHGRKQNRKDV